MRVAPIKKISKILRQVSLPSFFAQKYWMKKSLVKTLMLLTDWGLKRCNVGELFCNYPQIRNL